MKTSTKIFLAVALFVSSFFSGAVFAQNKIINVNLYGNNDPYNDATWNNWAFPSSLTATGFKYSDGTSSTVGAVLSSSVSYADNSANYLAVTMCPQKVARYTSYASTTRTLTINQLDNSKTYKIELYATRSSAGQTTRFTINGVNVDIATANNTANIASFDNISPVSGNIVVTLASLATYNYLNGFTITEKPSSNQPPVVNAGNDQSIQLPTSSATLTGTATDNDGTIASRTWSFISGPATPTIAAPTALSTSVTGLTAAGNYTFRLSATDNSGATSTDDVIVTVLANQPPIANAGLDKSIQLPITTTSLTGTATDNGGTVTSTAWSFVSGPATPTIATPNALTTSITGLTVAGNYTFRLTATDNGSATGTDDIVVTVLPTNVPPVVNAGSDQVINTPSSSTTLIGTATDNDGTVTSTAWSFVSGPATPTITTPNALTTSISGLTAAGTYTFRLTATDNNGATTTDDVVVLVNQLPVVNAGNDQPIQLPTSSVTLTGTATDNDGTIASRTWSFISGPATPTIVTPNTLSTSVTGLTAVGTYTFRLTATDNNSATGTDDVLVIVAAANQPPVVNAGNDQSIQLPTSSATLTGTATDNDGTIASRTWSFISGPATPTIVTPNTLSTSVTGLTAVGTYTFRLSATDNSGATSTDDVIVFVNPANNISPTVNAGLDKSIQLPATTTSLTGTASDNDGTITSTAWSFISGPATPTIATPSALTTSITGLTVAGNYTFRLSATDNSGATSTDDIIVTVLANQPPTANAGLDKSIQLPATTTSLTGTATDNDGTITSTAWSFISGPATPTIATPGSLTTSISGLTVAGTYTFRLTATDNGSATGTDDVIVTVLANQPPIANAGLDKSIQLPITTTSLTGTASDNDGTITSTAWSFISGPATPTIATPGSLTTSISGLTVAGTYTFRLTATDNGSATGTDDVIVTVLANQPPTANAGLDKSIQLPVTTTSLTGTANDNDGTITSTAWSFISGPATPTIATPSALTTSISGLTAAGTYTFRLTATDNGSATGTDDVLVIVAAANQPPVVNAGNDQSIQLPTSSVTLTGTATDNDGTIASRTWSFISGPATPTIVTPNTLSTSVTGLNAAGTYTFRLTTTDNNGASASDDVVVTVAAAPPSTTAKWNFTKTPFPVSGWNNMVSTSTSAIGSLSSTDASTGWNLITNGAQWESFFNTWPALNNGEGGSSAASPVYHPDFPANSIQGGFINAGHSFAVSGANYPFELTNLPAGRYSITAISSVKANVNSNVPNAQWHCKFGAAADTSGNIAQQTNNTQTVVVFTGTILAGERIRFGPFSTDENVNTTSAIANAIVIRRLNNNPVANAGIDKTIQLPVTTVSITGTATDSDGSVASTLWSFVSGPATPTIVTPASLNTTINGLTVAGTYTFRLTATDNNGGIGNDDMIVTVTPAIPPVVNAGEDKVISQPQSTITLTGTATDADGTITSTTWLFISGPVTPSIVSPSLLSTTVNGLTNPGLYTFKLSAIDNATNATADTVVITVTVPNNAPLANAGADQTVTQPASSATLSGSGTDTDGTIVSQTWSFISGPVTPSIATPSSFNTVVNGLTTGGTYLFKLVVTDNIGANTADTVAILLNSLPVVNAGADQLIQLPTNSVTLNGVATDITGTITAYNWTKITGPSGSTITTPASATTTVTGLVVGSYSFRLEATDSYGATAADTIVITVMPVNNFPTVNAGPDQLINLPTSSVTLSSTAADTDGTIASYSWSKVSGPASGVITTPTTASTTVTGLVQGVYTIRVLVTDNVGGTAADTVVVTVNNPPTVNAGNDITVTSPVNSTTLTGTATDSDGTITSTTWSVISSPVAPVINTPNSLSTTVNGLTAGGSYIFKLSATDNNSVTRTDTIVVTIQVNSNQSVLDPADPIVNYNSASPPAQPTWGQIGKWVRTPILNWNTTGYKSYIYKGSQFRLKFPKTYNPSANDGKKYPILIFFHGVGERGGIYDNEYQLLHGGQFFNDAVDAGTFDGYVLAMQTQGGWGSVEYGNIKDILDYMVQYNKLDPYRVINNGLSGGAQGVWEMYMNYRTYVSAIMPMSGVYSYLAGPTYVEANKFTPIWNSHGNLDGSPAPYTAQQVEDAMKAAGGNYIDTNYANLGHGVWTTFWQDPNFWPYTNKANTANPWPLFGRTEFCPGDPINVTIGLVAGFDGYQWRKNGVVINGATSNTIAATDTGKYDARVLRAGIWSDWSPIPVYIKHKAATITPDITLASLSSKVLPAPDGSTTVTLQVPAGYTSYVWQKVGNTTTIGNARTYTASATGDYIVKVTEQYGCSSSFSNPFTVINANGSNKPDAAIGLIATSISKTSIKLNWSQNPTPQFNETGFEIYQSVESGTNYKYIGMANADISSYVVNGLNANSTYYYIIRAVNNTAAAAVSNEASTTTNSDTQAPTAPSNLVITSSTQSTITLKWNAATDDVGVTKYYVFINGEMAYTTTDTNYVAVGLTYKASYTFAVKAADLSGNISPFSNQVSGQPIFIGLNYKHYTFTGTWNTLPDFNTLTPVVTGIMPNVAITPRVQDDNFAFLWEGYIKIPTTGTYQFRTSSDDGSKLYLGALNGTGSPYSFSATATVNNDGLHGVVDATSSNLTLTAGVYPIAVSFYEQGGGEAMTVSWRTPASGTTFIAIPDSAFTEQPANNGTAPAAPSNLTVTAATYKQINIGWTDNSTNETAFEIWRSLSSSSGFAVVGTAAANATTFADTTVSANTRYYYKIRSIGLYGESVLVGNALNTAITPALPAAPAAPSALLATAVSPNKVNITWTDNATTETSIELYRSSNNNSNYVLLKTLDANTTAYADSGLFANAIYYYKVRTVGVGGNSAYSNEDSAKLMNSTPLVNAISNKHLHYSATLQVPVSAVDNDGDPLTLAVTNLPSFGNFVSTGSGTGTITFAPSISTQGTFNNITVTANDPNGGTNATTFNVVVDANYDPVINAISSYTLNESDSVTIALSATDQNAGDILTWSVSGLPNNYILTPGANGAATLKLKPGFAAAGIYTPVITVTDGSTGKATATFNLTVNDKEPPVPSRIYVRFQNQLTVGTPWNNITSTTTNNLKDDANNTTSVGLQMPSNWYSTYNEGTNGNGTGIYPDPVLKEYYFFGSYPGIFTGPATVSPIITGLDTLRRYDLTFFATSSWSQQVNNGITTFTANNQTVSLPVQANTQNTVTISTIKPDANGSITFTAGLGANTTVGYINAIVISSRYDDGTLPADPRSLTAQLVSTGVRLNWQDVAYNENNYEIYRSLNGTTFSLAATIAGNLNSYIDSTVNGKTKYYYKVRATNNYGQSGYTNTVDITTVNRPPVIAAISDVSLKNNQTATVNVTVTDEPADVIKLTVTNLPTFVTFTDNGNGTGVFNIVPVAGIVGTYYNVTVTATDNSNASTSKSFNINVADKLITSTYINFTDGQLLGPKPWNNYTAQPFAGAQLTNIKDEFDSATGMALTLNTAFQWYTQAGMKPRNGRTIYPEAVMRTALYEGTTSVRSITLSGLSNTKKYNLVFFNSHEDGFKGKTTFTANSQSVTLDATYNAEKTAQINGLVPDATGKITFTVAKVTGEDYAYLTSLIVQSYPNTSTLLSPADLRVITNKTNSITLQWQDRSFDETGFEVWRATSLNGTYSLIATTAANATTYTNTGLTKNTTYYYKVRATSGTPKSDYTNTVGATAYDFMVYVNFASTLQGPAPWNNMNSVPQQNLVVSNFKNDAGSVTPMGVKVTKNFDGLYSAGVQTGNNSGIYPDNVMFDSYGLFPGNSATLKVTGLHLSRKYDLTFFGSSTVWGDLYTAYTVNGKTVLLDASVNSTGTVTMYGVTPNSDGEIYIDVAPGTPTSQFGLLGALIVNGYTAPAADQNSGSGIQNPNLRSAPVDSTYITKSTDTPAVTTTNNAVVNSSNSGNTNVAASNSNVIDPEKLTTARAYPNPFDNNITLAIPAIANDKVMISIYNSNGQLVYSKEFGNLSAGTNTLTITPQLQGTGMYWIKARINSQQATITFKMLKK